MTAIKRGDKSVNANLILLSTGLAFTIATQLRLSSLPVGPGELLLVTWAVASWVEIVGRKDIRIRLEIKPFVYFFAAVVIMLCFSLIYQIGHRGNQTANALHDLLAYLLVSGLVFTFGLLRRPSSYLWLCLKVITTSLTLLMTVLLVISKFRQSIGPIVLDNGFRFSGAAENPNQLGMAMVPVPFLCALFIREATTVPRRLGYACCFVFALWVGFETGSDALKLAWIVGFTLFGAATLVSKISARAHPAYKVGSLFMLAALALVFVSATPLGPKILESLEAGDGGGSRLVLWRQAGRVVFESPIVGRGPGEQKLIEYSSGGSGGGEAHNSYLDLALAAGLIGVAAALWLSGSLMLRPSLVARPALWSTFMAIQCYIMFHYMFRHPLFWFYMILITSFAYQDYEARARQRPEHSMAPARLDLRRA